MMSSSEIGNGIIAGKVKPTYELTCLEERVE